MKLKVLLTAAVLAGTIASAHALTVVQAPSGTGDNFVSNPCSASLVTTGISVFGCLQNDHAQVVQVMGSETLTIGTGGGQASIDSVDGQFTFAKISLVDSQLTGVVLNIDAAANGFVTFADGAGTDGTYVLVRRGQNFFTITGVTGGFLSFTSTVAVDDLNQIRVAGVVPEPETYALMLAGLGMIGALSRRRERRQA